MRWSYAPHMLHTSYWEFFQSYYTPQLAKMDLILKTIESPICADEAARALAMTTKTVEKIMAQQGVSQIDQEGFLQIAMHGDSSLCRLLQRECMCGSPERYSPGNIAYIYGLQDDHVAAVCRKHGYEDVPAEALPEFLSKVYVYILQ